MAPMIPSNTARYWVDYRSNGRDHTAMFRYVQGALGDAPDITQLASYLIVLNAFASVMPTNLVYLGARFANPGSNVSLPTALPVGLITGVNVPNPGEAPAFWSVPGRTVAGQRARFTMLGAALSAAQDETDLQDYRMAQAESVEAAAICNAMDQAEVVGIDGEPVVWKNYCNVGYNAHWQRAVRS